jgi:hypothetical protein
MNQIVDPSIRSHILNFWNMIRHELLYVLWAMMEIAIIAPLALAFMPWARYWSPTQVTLLILLLMLIPFNLSRVSSILSVPVQRQQILMVVGLLLTLLLSWRMLVYQDFGLLDFGWLVEMFSQISESGNPYRSRSLALFVLVVVGWWRGISLVGRRVDVLDTGLRLRTGILLLAILVAGVAGTFLDWTVTPFVLLFLFSALLAVILTRVEQLEYDRSGRSFPLGPRWLFAVIAVAGFLTFTTGIIAGALSGDPFLEIFGWLSPVWLASTFLLATVASTISFLIVPIIKAIVWLLDLIPIDFSAPALEPIELNLDSPFATVEPEEMVEQTTQLADTAQKLLPVLIMVFIVLLVALALGQIFRMARQPAKSDATSLGPLDGIGGLESPGGIRGLLDRLGFLKRWRAATSIRRIYRSMSEMAGDHGYPRLEYETPYEYLDTLEIAWPNQTEQTRIITEAYIQVRYGEIPESKDELDQIVIAWDQLLENQPADVAGDTS